MTQSYKNPLLACLVFLFSTAFLDAQPCDCQSNFEWVKKTFEENDAGFQHILNIKGEPSYSEHNKQIVDQIKNLNDPKDCNAILTKWLQFFRSGHLAIVPNEVVSDTEKTNSEQKWEKWETFNIKTEDFKKYLNKKKSVDFEGIWKSGVYTIGIKKEADQYIGFIIASDVEHWKKGNVKLKFKFENDKATAVFYLRDYSALTTESVEMIGQNHLLIGDINLSRIEPKMPSDPKYNQYIKYLEMQSPYLETWNETTLYLRIPSFNHLYKSEIDSVINANKNLILSTKNLIIDIRNNGGGSDNSYSEITPFLYTNPVKVVGVEFLSTKLNNQRMLDLINNPEYGFDDETKKWFQASFDKLEQNLGHFVNLSNDNVSTIERDTMHRFPENIGILINKGNASTAEQFLLEAKQSKKVKLFGVTTMGVLDISNMHFIKSPCDEFQFGYSLSRSMRIPDFMIDEIGLQPDYFIDKSIPQHEWTNYVNDILNKH